MGQTFGRLGNDLKPESNYFEDQPSPSGRRPRRLKPAAWPACTRRWVARSGGDLPGKYALRMRRMKRTALTLARLLQVTFTRSKRKKVRIAHVRVGRCGCRSTLAVRSPTFC